MHTSIIHQKLQKRLFLFRLQTIGIIHSLFSFLGKTTCVFLAPLQKLILHCGVYLRDIASPFSLYQECCPELSQAKDVQDCNNLDCRIYAEHSCLLVSVIYEVSKTIDVAYTFCYRSVIFGTNDNFPFHTCLWFQSISSKYLFFLHDGKTKRKVVVALALSYLSIPVRAFAFWANSGYDRFARKPFMAAFKALVGFKQDFFHAPSMPIIGIQSN